MIGTRTLSLERQQVYALGFIHTDYIIRQGMDITIYNRGRK